MAHDYLTVADVLGMHTVLMQRYGGAPGVRDPGALEAALFRPQTGYYDDIVAEAAALLESLAINHPFVDGNKRIAFAAADVFLRINGWRLQRAAQPQLPKHVHFLANMFSEPPERQRGLVPGFSPGRAAGFADCAFPAFGRHDGNGWTRVRSAYLLSTPAGPSLSRLAQPWSETTPA